MPVQQDQDVPAQPRVTKPDHLLPEHATAETAQRSGGGWRLWVVVLVVLLLAALIVWRIRSTQQEDQREASRAAAMANRPTPVQTVPVEFRTVPVFLSALGTVTAYNTVTLHSRVDGQLLRVNFTEGQQVRKGQLLLQIDPRPYQATLDQAMGTLAKDQATLRNNQAEAARYTALYQAGVVSRETQQTQVTNAGTAEGSIKADQAAIEAARVNLGYTKIYSPIDGIVGLRQVDPGNIVHASDQTGLVVITQVRPIAVVFTLPEDQLPLVQQAMKGGHKLVVEAYDRSDSHKIAAGTLLTIDNQIDTTTGTAKLKAIFDNADNALFANQFVNVRLILNERENATVIPTAAIESGTQGDYVFVVNPGPTPPEKRKNLPGGGAGPQGGHGGRGGHGGAPGRGGADAGAAGEHGAPGGEQGGAPRPQFHADTVPVHVDFVIGTMSVLSTGELREGQQVVVDGQEKLVDGSPVSPQAARNRNGRNTGSNAAGSGPGNNGAAGTGAAGAAANGGTQGTFGQAARDGLTTGTSPAVPETPTQPNNAAGPPTTGNGTQPGEGSGTHRGRQPRGTADSSGGPGTR